MAAYPQISLLASWPAEKQGQFIGKLQSIVLTDGQSIFENGDKTTDVYFILRGATKSVNYGPDGSMTYFRIRHVGDCFGYYSAISGESRTATMLAVGDTELAKISGPDFFNLVLENPPIGRIFMKLVVGLLRTETRRLTNLTTLPARQRIAAELLTLSANQKSQTINLPSRVEWAGHLGVTRETLARILNGFVKQGFVKIDGNKVAILNTAGLQTTLNEED
ncbi:MAG: cyclic nucleotide-binding domain-containing protein [Alphaproteobacteria bacterium]|nr:cyclic nucleotide-binding domain-containing protein [Alphaproteobacteria bacterium]